MFLSVVLPFSSRFWLLAFCFGCFCAEEKTSADSRLRFLLSMRCRYLQDLGGNHMTKPVVIFAGVYISDPQQGEEKRVHGIDYSQLIAEQIKQLTKEFRVWE